MAEKKRAKQEERASEARQTERAEALEKRSLRLQAKWLLFAKKAMSASVALAELEAARKREANNVADLGRSLIAKRNDLTSSRGELFTKLESVVNDWFSGPIAGYLKAHNEFVGAVESLEKVQYTEGGARKFSSAIELMLERLRGEAGLRPEPPERQPNDMQRLRDGVRQLIHGHPCEQRSEVERARQRFGWIVEVKRGVAV